MALIDCYECGKQISDIAPACPTCGAPSEHAVAQAIPERKVKKVGPLRKLAIVIFWGFVGLSVLGYVFGDKPGQKRELTLEEQGYYPDSSATYAEVNSKVGCKSPFSDEKKEDIFNANYRNKWMEWKGEIVLLEAGKASLNTDGIGIQDLSVRFENESAGYDLRKGSTVTVRFLMKSMGGCFLPFSGEKANIVN